jgi:hypothetical protein
MYVIISWFDRIFTGCAEFVGRLGIRGLLADLVGARLI